METPPPRSAKETRAPRPPKERCAVQFDLSPDDYADLNALVGDEMKNRTTVARRLFLYGLDHSEAAFAAYAKPHQEKRRERIAAAKPRDQTVPTIRSR